MDLEYLSIIIEISACTLTFAFGIWQIIGDRTNKYIGNPFEEYDSGTAWKYTLCTERLWKINLFILYASLAIYYAAYIYTSNSVELSSQYSRHIAGLIIIIDLATVFIKDLFHNKLAYTKRIEHVHRRFFDDINSIYISLFTEVVIVTTLIVAVIVGRNPKTNDICIVLLVVVAELFFCFFRILHEEGTLIHAHVVKSINIAMADGTEYKRVPILYDYGETIRIQARKDIVLYLPKSNILYIEKEIDRSNLIETIKNELDKQ